MCQMPSRESANCPCRIGNCGILASGISYRALLAVGPRANPYAAARRPNPKDLPPVARRYDSVDRIVRITIDTSSVEMAIGRVRRQGRVRIRP